MTKRFCKMNRKQIAESLGDISRLIAEPKYVCRSCARASANKGSLCKPATLSLQKALSKPIESAAVSLPERLLQPSAIKPNPEKSQAVKRVVERVKQQAQQNSVKTRLSPEPKMTTQVIELLDPKAVKKARKALKMQYKQQKKWLKLVKKHHKLLKKQQKLEGKVTYSTMPELIKKPTSSSVH